MIPTSPAGSIKRLFDQHVFRQPGVQVFFRLSNSRVIAASSNIQAARACVTVWRRRLGRYRDGGVLIACIGNSASVCCCGASSAL